MEDTVEPSSACPRINLKACTLLIRTLIFRPVVTRNRTQRRSAASPATYTVALTKLATKTELIEIMPHITLKYHRKVQHHVLYVSQWQDIGSAPPLTV